MQRGDASNPAYNGILNLMNRAIHDYVPLNRLVQMSYAVFLDPPNKAHILDVVLVPGMDAFRLSIPTEKLVKGDVAEYAERLSTMIKLTEDAWRANQRQKEESRQQ